LIDSHIRASTPGRHCIKEVLRGEYQAMQVRGIYSQRADPLLGAALEEDAWL
jgi:hypothetical protein